YALYPHMSVAENMAFSLRLRGATKADRFADVRRAAEVLDLSPLLDRYPAQLSGGQRQRVAMGRAIVRDPQVFLFDEPLSNLDAKLRIAMRTEIKSLYQRLGTTTVYVTHDQVEALTLADKIVILQDGRTAQIGAPLDIYERPMSVFVAGFIGSPAMNFLPATMAEDGASAHTASGAVLPMPATHEATPGQRLIYGIRPEHIAIAPTGLPARVRVVEPTGAETIINTLFEATEVVLNLRDAPAVRPGEKLSLSIDPAKAHIFDAETSERLN
ncbi:MAG: ATP-binding cassette domain-containing protein, partial [Pseudomonadota bacterium]